MFKSDIMKMLFTVTAALEAGTGFLLVGLPSILISLLLGTPLNTPAGLTVARIAGVALLALGIACWQARSDSQSIAAKGLVSAMMIYNGAVSAILMYAGLGLELSTSVLWIVVLIHTAMFFWCLLSLIKKL